MQNFKYWVRVRLQEMKHQAFEQFLEISRSKQAVSPI